MSLKTALYSYLTGIAAVTNLVGTRIRPGVAAENDSLPYVIYNIISSEHVRHMSAASDFAARRVQFDVYGATPESTENVFDALRDALESKRGAIGSENLSVLSSGIDSERDEYVDPVDGSQVGKYRRSIDYLIWHRL